jgi:hypothetical protein
MLTFIKCVSGNIPVIKKEHSYFLQDLTSVQVSYISILSHPSLALGVSI